jgi:hypothetical protein
VVEQMSLQALPSAHQRRAMRTLHDASLDAAPGWHGAALGAVRPLYRPGHDKPAYYEIGVTRGGRHAGFLVLSAADHDMPVAHWGDVGASPTERLSAIADRHGKAAARFYKLDSLTYVAEDERGERVARLGDEPFRIGGIDASAAAAHASGTGSRRWNADSKAADDSETVGRGRLVATPPKAAPKLSLHPWSSWAELKKGYAATYAHQLEDLKHSAGNVWKGEAALARHGEVLVAGQTKTVRFLPGAGASVAVSGAGAKYVESSPVAVDGREAGVRLRVTGGPPTPEPVVLSLKYGTGKDETINFAVVSHVEASKDPRTRERRQPRRTHPLPPGQDPTEMSPWDTSLVGTWKEQRKYDQIPAQEWPSNSDCPSGCGPTAWAMLFGWADWKASTGDEEWKDRWGLFRVGNGKRPARDAVAPELRKPGSDVSKMTWELRDYVDTTCIAGAAPTMPIFMGQAHQFFDNRSNCSLTSDYNSFGFNSDDCRMMAETAIWMGRPAIIGTGHLSHYPLAYGYRIEYLLVWDPTTGKYDIAIQGYSQFKVNEGWGPDHDPTWVPSGTWFAGTIRPFPED